MRNGTKSYALAPLSLIPFLALLAIWSLLSISRAAILVPAPWRVFSLLCHMAATTQMWTDMATTLLRGATGLMLASILAFTLGLTCGLSRHLMNMLSPFVSVLQSCPPVVWISLLMVWLSTGWAVPVVAVAISTFPVLFINISIGTSEIDRGLFALSNLYQVPYTQRLIHLILPGIAAPCRSAYAFATGITWKVTATAEFLGATDGIGARLQESFQRLDMTALFAWTLLIIIPGIILDFILKSHTTAPSYKGIR